MKNLKSIKNLTLIFILIIIPLFVTVSFGLAEQEDEDDTIVVKNPNTILAQHLLPGFQLSHSSIVKNKKTGEEEYMAETWGWCKVSGEEWENQIKSGKNVLEIERILVKIKVYHFEDKKEALESAKQLYHVRTDKDFERGPIRGSYTGQKIGDICWRGLSPEEIRKYSANPIYTSSPDYDIIFIKNGTLVSLDVHAFAKQIPASFAEDVAKKIVSRIK